MTAGLPLDLIEHISSVRNEVPHHAAIFTSRRIGPGIEIRRSSVWGTQKRRFWADSADL